MKKSSRGENAIWLFDFLCKVNSVNTYAKIFYHLEDAENSIDHILLETMLESGKHAITTCDDVENYMNLAIIYWNIQRYKYSNKKIEEEENKQLKECIEEVKKYWEGKPNSKVQSDETKG